MQLEMTLLVAIKTITLVCGAGLTWFTYKAYRRNGTTPLRSLCIGIGLITAGTLLAGTLHLVLAFPVVRSVIVQSSFTATGFVMLLYSLYSEESIRPEGS